jgi:hypothetical protein
MLSPHPRLFLWSLVVGLFLSGRSPALAHEAEFEAVSEEEEEAPVPQSRQQLWDFFALFFLALGQAEDVVSIESASTTVPLVSCS